MTRRGFLLAALACGAAGQGSIRPAVDGHHSALIIRRAAILVQQRQSYPVWYAYWRQRGWVSESLTFRHWQALRAYAPPDDAVR